MANVAVQRRVVLQQRRQSRLDLERQSSGRNARIRSVELRRQLLLAESEEKLGRREENYERRVRAVAGRGQWRGVPLGETESAGERGG